MESKKRGADDLRAAFFCFGLELVEGFLPLIGVDDFFLLDGRPAENTIEAGGFGRVGKAKYFRLERIVE